MSKPRMESKNRAASRRYSKVVVSRKLQITKLLMFADTHCGCEVALHPKSSVLLDAGSPSVPSILQTKLYTWFELFVEWARILAAGDPMSGVIVGDIVDGVHHNSVSQRTQNMASQVKIAKAALEPITDLCNGGLYLIRGTEAHAGKSSQWEELIGGALPNIIPDASNNYSRYELWLDIDNILSHFSHHIGTTAKSGCEGNALQAELAEMYTQAGRHGNRPPNLIVRGHSHRFSSAELFVNDTFAQGITLPAWQLKTAYTHKIALGRVSEPQVGGAYLEVKDGRMRLEKFVRQVAPPRIEYLREIVNV